MKRGRERHTFAVHMNVTLDVPEGMGSESLDAAVAILHGALRGSTGPHASRSGRPHLVGFEIGVQHFRTEAAATVVPLGEARRAEGPTLRSGDFFYSTCSADRFAEVLAVGEDDNGVPTIDLAVESPDDLITMSGGDPDFPDFHGLTTLELPPQPDRMRPRAILRKVQYRYAADVDWAKDQATSDGYALTGATFELKIPGEGCDKCVRFLFVERRVGT
mgnify:CR=1 FL=1